MSTLSRARFCPACAQAQALLNRLSLRLEHEPITPDEVIATLPLLLETALADLLADFDAHRQAHTRTEQAIRLVALGAERAQCLLEARTQPS
jgi:hypothetical protein